MAPDAVSKMRDALPSEDGERTNIANFMVTEGNVVNSDVESTGYEQTILGEVSMQKYWEQARTARFETLQEMERL